MIYCKSLKPILLALTLVMAASTALPPSVQAQNGEPVISLGQVRLGKKEDTNWLKVDMRKQQRPSLGASTTTTRYSSTVRTKNIQPVAPLPKYRVANTKLVLASRIAVNHSRSHSTKSCWRYVKNALLEAEVVDSRPTTGYAKQAGAELEQNFGFVKTNIRNPLAAPLGSVLVYGGKGAGHVEIRAMEGFVSDFVSPKPSPRPLIGVYVKR